MSEFQYYEFHAIDNPLSNEARKEIGSWSSRTYPSDRKAVFTYHYGDFPKDEDLVLLQFFDTFFYYTNWGTKRLMLKFPHKIVDLGKMQKYLSANLEEYDNDLKILKIGDFVILDMTIDEDDCDWYDVESGCLESLVILRNEILNGDYRSIFLMWLKFFQLNFPDLEFNDDRYISSDMIPCDLQSLNASHYELIDFLNINMDWLNAFASFSSKLSEKKPNYSEKLKQLSEGKKDDFLLRLLKNEPNLATKLKIKLRSKREKETFTKIFLSDVIDQINAASDKRIEDEKSKKHKIFLKRMLKIEKNEQSILQSIEDNIMKGSGRSYDDALESLKDLRKLAQFKGQEEGFQLYLNKLRKKYGRKTAMMRRMVGLDLQQFV